MHESLWWIKVEGEKEKEIPWGNDEVQAARKNKKEKKNLTQSYEVRKFTYIRET